MRIDIEKSIKNKHLKIKNLSFSQKLDTLFDAIVPLFSILGGVIFPILLTVQGLKESREIAIFPLIIFSPFILLGFLSLYALIYGSRLIQFAGIDEEFNRKTMSGILEQRFKIPINFTGGEAMMICKEASFLKFGTRIIVVFRNSNVFINITRFNYRGLKSPFHTWLDSFEIRSIIKDFNDKTKITA